MRAGCMVGYLGSAAMCSNETTHTLKLSLMTNLRSNSTELCGEAVATAGCAAASCCDSYGSRSSILKCIIVCYRVAVYKSATWLPPYIVLWFITLVSCSPLCNPRMIDLQHPSQHRLEQQNAQAYANETSFVHPAGVYLLGSTNGDKIGVQEAADRAV